MKDHIKIVRRNLPLREDVIIPLDGVEIGSLRLDNSYLERIADFLDIQGLLESNLSIYIDGSIILITHKERDIPPFPRITHRASGITIGLLCD